MCAEFGTCLRGRVEEEMERWQFVTTQMGNETPRDHLFDFVERKPLFLESNEGLEISRHLIRRCTRVNT
jgi:hypothetical protein